MALRNQLVPEQNLPRLLDSPLNPKDSSAIADVAIGIKTAEAGTFLLRHIQTASEDREKLTAYLRHAARYASESEMGKLSAFTRTKFADDIDFQLALFKSAQEGASQRGSALGPGVREWGAALAEQLFVSVDANSLEWRNMPIKGGDTTNPWFLEKRESADGDKASRFISSLSPGGEKLVGILRSKPFTIPARLSFFLAGHDGSPDKPPVKKNLIRLRNAATQEIIARAVPPRNDIPQPISWDLGQHAGEQGYLEIVDGNRGHSYAWLAVGRFNPAVVALPKIIPNHLDNRQPAAAELAGALHLEKL